MALAVSHGAGRTGWLQEGLSGRAPHAGLRGVSAPRIRAPSSSRTTGDTSKYEFGNAFGHVVIEVEDTGGKVTREPGPMKHGTAVIAFVEDPDGYKIELIEKGQPGS